MPVSLERLQIKNVKKVKGLNRGVFSALFEGVFKEVVDCQKNS